MRTQETQLRKNFLEFLVDKDFLSRGQMEDLDEELGRIPEIEIRDILLERYLASEEDIYSIWAQYLDIPYIDLRLTTFDPKALELIPSNIARKNSLVPFGLYPGELCVAFDNLDVNITDALRRQTGCDILVHIATRSRIIEAIQIQYGSIDVQTESEKIDLSIYTSESLESREVAEVGPVVQIGDGIIINAIKDRASDIHVEPREDYLGIRFRIDGVLQEKYKMKGTLGIPLVSRYKIMANLDIAEKRIPQDGRIQYAVGERKIDIRVSVIPANSREKIVLRILDKSGNSLDIEQMHFSKQIHHRIKRLISAPHGIFFVTGPTGSGKTTTLYTILNYLNNAERNIVTIEDPIEYRLPMINQTQVNHEIGLDFPSALRSLLRQDPDIILVGEIRDMETAKIATESALTGHLVFSTLHTNSAVDAVTRLIEIGVDPFLVAPSLLGILAQRLVRRICKKCKESYMASPDEMRILGASITDDPLELYKGNGCPTCRGSGFSGRIAIHELVVVTDEIRDLVFREASSDSIAEAAYKVGYRSMRFDGLKKAMRGLTTIGEVTRVTTAQDDLLV